MRGVIEHLIDFKKIIKLLRKSLNKNGIFYICATPNSYSLAFELSPSKFNQNHPGHLFHFNHVNLTKMFFQLNFLLEDLKMDYLKTPYQNTKKDFIKLKKLSTIKKSPPAVGNMMTLVFRKIK